MVLFLTRQPPCELVSRKKRKERGRKTIEGLPQMVLDRLNMGLTRALKYSVFVFRYFKHPIRILHMYIRKRKNTLVELRNGGKFDSFGYGDAGLGLYRIWGACEYGIRPKDAKRFQIVIDIGAHIGFFSVLLGVLNPKCLVL